MAHYRCRAARNRRAGGEPTARFGNWPWKAKTAPVQASWCLDFLGLRRALLGARRGLGAAADIDTGAVAAGNFRIDEARHQHAAIEADDFAIALACGRFLGKSDVILAIRPALEHQFGRLRLVGEVHHDAAARAAADIVGLLALAAGRGFDAR